jgi:hypothetical protein
VIRLGLRESLEEYAARNGVTPDRARVVWRAEGLRLLNAIVPRARVFGMYGSEMLYAPASDVSRATRAGVCSHFELCRVAPGVAVPCRAVVGFE